MNKKQTFTKHQNTKRMPGTKIKIINVTSFTIKLNKTIANKNSVTLVYL